MGPLITATASRLGRTLRGARTGRGRHAAVRRRTSRRRRTAKQGFFYSPTILEGLTNEARICQEEIFGPVLVAMPFDDEASLMREANDSVFGLAAGIWTRDYKRAWRVGRALEAGTVWINTYKQFSISTPFGGWKDSGMGREKGRLGIREYMQQKSLYWGLNDAPLAWAN